MAYQDVYWSNCSHQAHLKRCEKKLMHHPFGSDEYKLFATLSDYHEKVISQQRRKKRLLTKEERIKIFKKVSSNSIYSNYWKKKNKYNSLL